jgi:tetratricopeptide (TPR) repeat protein
LKVKRDLKKYSSQLIGIVVVSVLTVAMYSCSTRKNTFGHRAYHGITTRYNIYFNGNESFKEAQAEIADKIRDDYTNILPVYPVVARQTALESSPKLDRAIEKASKAIYKHSMLIRGVEYCKPMDDTYLLMGKAYYLRQDYADALNIFSYITTTHKNGNVWADAFTWKAETYLKMNNITEAEASLEEGRYPVSIHKKDSYRQHWEATMAQLLITQKEYDNATVYLQEVLKHKRIKKDFKTRVRFILAQIQQKLDQPAEAAKQYAMVLKKNPPYEMEFNATVNLALCSPEKSKDKLTARNQLKKMLKDERNETYKDQIFYALAQLDLRDEDTAAAVKNLEASVFWSIDNPYQKTVSALQLAEIYFAKNQYVESQKHYDTVFKNLPPTFPDYDNLKKRLGILKDLVEQLGIISHEDSLQKIASLPEEERLKYIDDLIAAYQQAEEERLADEEDKAAMMTSTKSSRSSSSSSSNSSSKWIFDNPTQVKLGEQAFRKRWGVRTLSDYWAVSNLSSSITSSSESSMVAASSTETTPDFDDDSMASDSAKTDKSNRNTDPTTRDFYLQDAPFTDEQMQASNRAIAGALYTSGTIYKEDLLDAKKAIAQWETLLQRFEEDKLYPATCFQLYRTYKEMNNEIKSDYYKDIILNKFPNTDYATLIKNPNYFVEVAQSAKEAETFYDSVYNTYKKENYPLVVQLSQEALAKYQSPELRPKLAFLHAISKGKIEGLDTMKVLLTAVTMNYPTTEIDTAAQAILEALKRSDFAKKDETNADTSKQLALPTFLYQPDNFHFIILIVNIKDTKVDQLKNKIYGFNKEYFRLQQFDVANIYLDETSQLLTISKFENKSNAMDYYHLLKSDNKYYKDFNQTLSSKVFAISDTNYPIFYKNKNLRHDYELFFNENYLKP